MPNRTARRSSVRTARPAGIDPLESRVLFATVVGLTADDDLVTFDTATPGTVSNPVAVTGLAGAETLQGIDYRPATGQLSASARPDSFTRSTARAAPLRPSARR